MSRKNRSTTIDTIEAIVCICVLSGFILSTSSYSVNVSADIFEDGRMETVKCQINNSMLNAGNCPNSNMPIEYVRILLKNNSKTTTLCAFRPFLNCTLLNQDPNVNSCGCYPEGNDIYIVNVTVTAVRNTFEGIIIDCYPSCSDNNGNYPFQNTYNGIPIVFGSTTQPPTTTPITTGTKATSSESTTAGSTSLPTTASTHTNINLSSSSVPNTAILECENCNCNDTCTCPKKCSEKCPVWCIVVAVCVPCGVCGIIIIIVIIVKKKKAKATGNRLKQSHRTEESAQDTREMQDKTKHHGTENRPKNAQGGSNRAEVSAQDTKEMQDKTKHLGTENSPEREKRRKKKKKKKTFQEVDGETVSRENKSTVNDHKAAQNDNSVSVNENSPITYNGELRSLPMPKTPHLTSVERNSTIFQSETPRKLPPLQPKAMIIP